MIPKRDDSYISPESMMEIIETDAAKAEHAGEKVGLAWKYAYAVSYCASEATLAKWNAAKLKALREDIRELRMLYVKGNDAEIPQRLQALEQYFI